MVYSEKMPIFTAKLPAQTVTVDGAAYRYVRSGAGGTYPILATAHRGDRLIALPEQNGWHRIAICCKGKLLTGYMSAKYIEYA